MRSQSHENMAVIGQRLHFSMAQLRSGNEGASGIGIIASASNLTAILLTWKLDMNSEYQTQRALNQEIKNNK